MVVYQMLLSQSGLEHFEPPGDTFIQVTQLQVLITFGGTPNWLVLLGKIPSFEMDDGTMGYPHDSGNLHLSQLPTADSAAFLDRTSLHTANCMTMCNLSRLRICIARMIRGWQMSQLNITQLLGI